MEGLSAYLYVKDAPGIPEMRNSLFFGQEISIFTKRRIPRIPEALNKLCCNKSLTLIFGSRKFVSGALTINCRICKRRALLDERH